NDTQLKNGHSPYTQHTRQHLTPKSIQPVSPISPSSPASIGFITATMGSVQLMDENNKLSSNASNDTNKRYDQTQYQQPRQQNMQKAHYGGGVPRQTPVVRNYGDLQSQGQHAQGHGASQGQGQGHR